MHSDITGILLAGGKSSRMGLNKALIRLGNKTVIERTAGLLKSVFSDVKLSTNSPREYSFLKLETIQDIYKDIGPLSGIHSGLVNSKTDKIFVMSCDMPLMTKEQIEFIISYPADKERSQIVVAEADGFIQQLCGIYSRSVLKTIDDHLIYTDEDISGNKEKHLKGCRVLRLLKLSGTTVINAGKEFPSYKKNSFYNMNRPEDFEFIKKFFE